MEMGYLQNVINNELKRMSNNDRETFKKVVLLTYNEIINEFQERIEYFENRLIDSVKLINRNTSIYSLVINREDYFIFEDIFFPLYDDDLNDIDFSKFFQNGENDEKIVKRLFIQKTYKDLSEFEGLVIEGSIIVNGNYYDVEYKIEIDKRYNQKIKELYNVFMINGQNWNTVNTLYMTKIFKVILYKYDENLGKENFGNKNIIINLDYRELEEYIVESPLLIWNVQEKDIIGTMLVRPTENNIRYEHTLKCSDSTGIYVYPKNENIFLTYITDKNNFHIITDKKNINIWRVWEIKKINMSYIEKFKKNYDKEKLFLANNNKKDIFVNSLREKTAIRIRSEAEIERIINSFEFVSEYLEYTNYSISEEINENSGIYYDMNDFVIDEFKIKGRKNFLNIYIKVKKYNIYTLDILSFIISEIQYYFSEYTVMYITV